MPSVTRLLLVALLGLVAVAFPATTTAAHPDHQAATAASVQVVGLAGQSPSSPVPSSPAGAGTAPEGPAITDPAQIQANEDKQQRKLVLGVVSIILLVIVFFGRRAHIKRRKRLKGATS